MHIEDFIISVCLVITTVASYEIENALDKEIFQLFPDLKGKEWNSLNEVYKRFYRSEMVRFKENKARLRRSLTIPADDADRHSGNLRHSVHKSRVDESLLRKFQKIQREYKANDEMLDKLESEIDHSVFITGHTEKRVTIDGFVNFKKPIDTRNIKGVASDSTIQYYRQSLESLRKDVDIIKSSLRAANDKLEDAVPRSGTDKLIEGTKYFYGEETSIGDLVASNANVGKLSTDGSSIDATLQNLVRVDDNRQIKGRKIFTGEISARELRTSTINGRNASFFMTTEEPSQLASAAYLNGISVKNDATLGTGSLVDGVDLSTKVHKHEGFSQLGKCHFKELKTPNGIYVDKDIINNEHLSHLSHALFKSDQDIVMEGPVEFENLLVKNDFKAAIYSDITSQKLFSNLALKTKNHRLRSLTLLSDCHVKNGLVTDTMNDRKFPKNFVVFEKDWINFGDKSFDNVHFNKLYVTGLVNSLNHSNFITKSSPQVIQGRKDFQNGMRIMGDLNIQSNLIDDVNVDHLFSTSGQNDARNTIIFKERVTARNVTVHGLLNNIKLEKVAADLVYKGEKTVTITGNKKFLKSLKVSNKATTDTLNGLKVSQLVNTKETNEILGKIIFQDKPVINNLKVDGFIDGVNITDLVENSVFLSKPGQSVRGSKYFENLYSWRLNVQNSINGHEVNTFLTKSTEQYIPGDIALAQSEFQTLNAKNVELDSGALINGKTPADLFESTHKNFVFGENLIIEGNARIKNAAIQRLNQRELNDFENILMNTRGQTIDNEIDIPKLIVSGSVRTSISTKGNIARLKSKMKKALRTNALNEYKNLRWEKVTISDIIGPRTVNNLNLKSIEADSVFLDDPRTFSLKGKKYFLRGFEVAGDLISPDINGKNLERIFSKTTKQEVNFPVTFQDLKSNNVYLKEFNSIKVRDIINEARRRHNSVTKIRGPIRFNGEVRVSQLEVNGSLAGLAPEILMEDAVRIPVGDQKIVIEGLKKFSKPITISDANLGILNGYSNIRRRREEVLRTQNLQHLEVNGTVYATKVHANNIISKDKIGLFSPEYVRKNFVLASEDILDPLEFASVHIKTGLQARRVNSLRVPEDLLTVNTEQQILKPLHMNEIETGDVDVSGKINGFSLPTSRPRNKEHVIYKAGPIMLDKELRVNSEIKVKGKIGRRKLAFPEDVVFLNSTADIHGEIKFVSSVITDSLSLEDKTLNGMKLSSMVKKLSFYSRIFEDERTSEEPSKKLESLQGIYTDLCQDTELLEESLQESYTEPHYLSLVSQQFFEDTSRNSLDVYDSVISAPQFDRQDNDAGNNLVLGFTFDEQTWLIDSLHYGPCKAEVLRWNPEEEVFEQEYSLDDIGKVHQWLVVENNPNEVYILSVATGEEDCITGSILWKITAYSGKLERIQELETAQSGRVIRHVESILLYLDFGYGATSYKFVNGRFGDSQKQNRVPVDKYMRRDDGTELYVRIWNEQFVQMYDSDWQWVFVCQNTKDLLLFTHRGEEYVVLYRRKFVLGRPYVEYEVHLYKNRTLSYASALDIGSPQEILDFQAPRDDRLTTFFLALYANEAPRIYKYTANGVRLWEELPVVLAKKPFAFTFVDSDHLNIVVGDENQMVTTKLVMNGGKFDESVIQC